jgi:hypothetical protein
MKLNDEERFPYPVLAPFTDDFLESTITFEVDVEEVPATSALSLLCTLKLDHNDLIATIQEGMVACYVNVVCRSTYFNEFYDISLDRTRIEVPPGLLRGPAQVRAVLLAKADLDLRRWRSIHPEFPETSRFVKKASVIAVSDEFRLDIGLDKLRPMESIFRLARSESLEEGEIAVDVDGQCIRINAAPKLFATINALRHTSVTKDILLTSVYFCASLQVMSLIQDDPHSFEDKWWFRVFSARCTQLDIRNEDGELLRNAQLMLNRPLGRLHNLEEVAE